MSTMAELGYVEGASSVVFDEGPGLWVAWAQRISDGGWDYYPATIHDLDDGSRAVWAGNNQQGWGWVDVTPAPTAIAHEPEFGLATMFPGETQKAKEAVALVKSPRKAVGALLYREPVHGKWYESAWMWGNLVVAALMAIIWMAPAGLNGPAGMNGGAFWGAGFAYFIWLFVGWVPLAASLIGALQKEGYRRLAAAYAIALTVAVSIFWESQMRDSENNG